MQPVFYIRGNTADLIVYKVINIFLVGLPCVEIIVDRSPLGANRGIRNDTMLVTHWQPIKSRIIDFGNNRPDMNYSIFRFYIA